MPDNGQENGVNGASAEKRKAEDESNGDTGTKKEKLEGGTLLFSGATDWKLVGRKNNELSKSGNTQWSPVRLAALKDVNVVGVNKGCSSAFCVVIDDAGQVWVWGRNEGGQLGVGHSKDLMVPTLVQELTGYNIVEVATGKAHALFLTSCGKVLAAGENEKGQCGQGKKTANLETPKLISHEGPDIVSVAAGAEFSVLLDKEGKVWTFGHPESGTLGHNDDGKFISRANKVDYRCEYSPKQVAIWVDKDAKTKEITHLPIPKIVKISCGPQHTVVVDEENKAYSWGFGGYGRLGHSETADQLVSLQFLVLFLFKIFSPPGPSSDPGSEREEPWSEGRGLRSQLQPGHLRDPGNGQHVGHLHPGQGGQHVPQAHLRPVRVEHQERGLQHQGKSDLSRGSPH